MKSKIKVLFIGDVVGQPGCRAIYFNLKDLKEKYKVDFTVVNGENAADGFGITPYLAEQIFSSGANVITTGNHIWQKKEILPFLEDNDFIIRPANYPQGLEGKGYCIFPLDENIKIGVINLQGVRSMPPIDNPFFSVDKIINRLKEKEKVSIILIDFHAELVPEKEAMGFYVDGRSSLLVGTHTHVQTADEKILPQGTGYISDIGMTGVLDSVIGSDSAISIKRSRTQMPLKGALAEGEASICGVVVDIEVKTGKCLSIERFIYE